MINYTTPTQSIYSLSLQKCPCYQIINDLIAKITQAAYQVFQKVADMIKEKGQKSKAVDLEEEIRPDHQLVLDRWLLHDIIWNSRSHLLVYGLVFSVQALSKQAFPTYEPIISAAIPLAAGIGSRILDEDFDSFTPYWASVNMLYWASISYSFTQLSNYYPIDTSIKEALITGTIQGIKGRAILLLPSIPFLALLYLMKSNLQKPQTQLGKKTPEISTEPVQARSFIFKGALYLLPALNLVANAFFEELAFRGGLTEGIKKGIGLFSSNNWIKENTPFITRSLVNTAFSLSHHNKNLFEFGTRFFLGWNASVLAEQTQDLWACSFQHVILNMIAKLSRSHLFSTILPTSF